MFGIGFCETPASRFPAHFYRRVGGTYFAVIGHLHQGQRAQRRFETPLAEYGDAAGAWANYSLPVLFLRSRLLRRLMHLPVHLDELASAQSQKNLSRHTGAIF
jgi:hypothetical protein